MDKLPKMTPRGQKLIDWCNQNGEWGQQLLSEWTGLDADNNIININNYTYGSAEPVRWRCIKGHEWVTAIAYRTTKHSRCPKCSRINESNTLLNWCRQNSARGERLIKEWVGLDEFGNNITMEDITYGATRKVYWKCSNDNCDYVWLQSPHGRAPGGYNCAACAGNAVSSINSLESWCKQNGEWGQQLLTEWNHELNNSIGLTPSNVAKSTDKKAYWTCNKEHTWIATISNRTGGKTGCPTCVAASTSYPEQFIYWALKQIYPRTESRCKVLKSPENPYGIEFDIGVPDIPLCIEYSPTYWHTNRHEADLQKIEVCKKYNVRLIQIMEDSYNQLTEVYDDDLIIVNMQADYRENILINIVDFILKSLGHSISEIDLETVKKNAWEYSHGKLNIEKAIITTHPELAKEFHPTLNGDRTPETISHGSRVEIYWQCIKCGYGSNGEWKSVPLHRSTRATSCPCCNYNFHDMDYRQSGGYGAITGINDIQTLHPRLALEWHPTLNDTTPDKVKPGSYIHRYWQCTKCDYGIIGEWYVRPSSRCNANQKSGCPNCKYNWFDDTVHRNYNAVAKQGENDLVSIYPELAKEWNTELNSRDIREISFRSHDKAYWTCTQCGYGANGEWVATVNRRTAKGYETGCPKCRYFWLTQDYIENMNKIAEAGVNDVATLHPWLTKEWHPTLNKYSTSQMKPYSRTRVYWNCHNCGYGKNGEWHTLIFGRINRKSGCPHCGYNEYKAQEGLPQKFRLAYLDSISKAATEVQTKVIPGQYNL